MINDPRITIESLMKSVYEGARRAVSSGGAADGAISSSENGASAARMERESSATGFPALTPIEAAPLRLQPSFEPHADDQYHVNDLLKYHDRNFIQNAYRAILKRGPDATGFTAFIENLRNGSLNKIDVLARLRYSTEGRAKRVQVKHLFWPAALRQLYRLPVVGYLLRLGVSLLRLPASVRHQQQFEAHVHAQQQLIVDQTNHLGKLLGEHEREVAQALVQLDESTRAATSRQQQQLELIKHEQEALRASLQAMQAALLERLAAVERQFDLLIEKAVAHWQREMHELEARQEARGVEIDARAGQMTESVRADAAATARELRGEVRRVFQKEQEVRAELALQAQRVARLLEEAGKRLPAPFDERQLEVFTDEQQHLDDAFYLALEESFRGSPAEIRNRLQVYLPLVEQAHITGEHPLLDIGCGRGEWLELLRDMNVAASGVDSNRALVAAARARGLEVVEADLTGYLSELPDGALGALTGFHIVEHLPLEKLLGLLSEAVRVVRPGGLILFETPNPENVLVGSCNFYFDPTHRNPLPAPVLKFMLESRGLGHVEIVRLNPSDAEPVAGDTDLVKRFNQYFYGPMDYAVVGWKA
ncbi:MAG TPA: methyltransferase domain-containing protein [Pyrinomonadaceae bacterium]